MEIIIPIVIVAFIAIAIIGAWQAAKRRKELAAWAAANGLSFTRAKDRSYDDRHPNFEALHKGSNRYAQNIMQGTLRGRGVWCFDYHYETHSTDSKGRRQTHHHHFSAVILATGLPMKPLFIRPEGFFDKVTEFFGYDDIDFELDAFSRAFYVKSPDKKWAFDVIHQETMEYMLHAPRFTMDFEGPYVMVYRGSRFKVAEFDAAVRLAEGILDRLPDYLLRELKGER